MNNVYINRKIAQLILLQRIELAGPLLKKIRKLFGRKLFTNFISKYLISPPLIGRRYMKLMLSEYEDLNKFVNFNNQKILSIGSGMSGLELVINLKNNSNFSIIEKNYTSQKVIYGWDSSNSEAYNNLKLLELFLLKNGMNKNKFEIYNFDTDELPEKHFDYILSLYSLDYHYNFDIYLNYIKKVSHNDTKIIFDTIRPEYFENVFKKIDIIDTKMKTVHKSKRIICSKFIL